MTTLRAKLDQTVTKIIDDVAEFYHNDGLNQNKYKPASSDFLRFKAQATDALLSLFAEMAGEVIGEDEKVDDDILVVLQAEKIAINKRLGIQKAKLSELVKGESYDLVQKTIDEIHRTGAQR